MSSAGAGNPVLVADVGNTRIKLARIADAGRAPLVSQRLDLSSREFRPENLHRWLAAAASGPAVLLTAAVNEAAATRLEAAVAEFTATGPRPVRQRRIGREHLPIVIGVESPDRVGIDRVCAAAAAASAAPGRPVVVVDCGTAITVDLVSPAGVFLGGAILPGPTLLARALAEGTSRLPEVAALETAPPPPLPGRSTQDAIAAGLGWGIRGAVTRLVTEARTALGGDADVILTGGSAGVVRDSLPGAIEMPDLVLAGIALAAARVPAG